jgi:uncharacterized protein YecE (DUF72 family)
MKIYIGTSGYSYRDWIGPVYPKGTKQEEMLQAYSALFPYSELNFSYYRMPEPGILEPMIRKTPESFRFGIKIHQDLTHHGVREGWEGIAKLFLEGIKPLSDSGKLAMVLLQFPFSFHYTNENRRYLSDLTGRLSSVPLCAEFRNREWQNERVYGELTDRRIGWVMTDSPSLEGLPLPQTLSTGPFAYLRFHGRNSGSWWNGDAVSRYDYLYNEGELFEWVPRILSLQGKTSVLYIAFNNHHKGQAVKNGVQMKNLLVAQGELEIA